MLNTNAEMIQAIKVNTDAFMQFSKIAISSIEQLTSLNLSTTRSSLEARASATASLLASNGALPPSRDKTATPLAASERAAAYLSGVQDIANEVQEAFTKVMTAYLSAPGNGSNLHAGWLTGFDAFKSMGQQFSALKEANSKVMSDLTARAGNQTNLRSQKSD